LGVNGIQEMYGILGLSTKYLTKRGGDTTNAAYRYCITTNYVGLTRG
jgi:hypothetical protein